MAPAFVRHARASDRPRFELGVASGSPGPTGVVLWTRLSGPDLPDRVEVNWELAVDEAFRSVVARGTETASAGEAHSVHAEPAGLEPARTYWYRFEALGQRSPSGRTRTAPAAEARATLSCIVASCQRWDHGYYAAWRHAAAQAPDLVMFLGDYIYEYGAVPGRVRLHEGGRLQSLDDYRRRYAQYKRDPDLQAAHAACPWLLVWDDHEVENDYAGASPLRAAAYRAWWEHQPVPKALRPAGPDLRITARLDWGRLARIHLLDDRQYRDPHACTRGGSGTVRRAECDALADPSRSLLGAAQERWLADGWDVERPWNLVAQQTLMAQRLQGDPARGDARVWNDGWDGYPAARRRLLAGLAERRVRGAVVLSGDIHAHVVADLKLDFDDDRSPVVASEFCGTSISSDGASQARTNATLRLNPHLLHARSDQRGYVRIVLDERELRADLMGLADPLDAGSTIAAAARFVVEAGRPGPQPG